jgi:hypothetical protein
MIAPFFRLFKYTYMLQKKIWIWNSRFISLRSPKKNYRLIKMSHWYNQILGKNLKKSKYFMGRVRVYLFYGTRAYTFEYFMGRVYLHGTLITRGGGPTCTRVSLAPGSHLTPATKCVRIAPYTVQTPNRCTTVFGWMFGCL